MLPRMADSLLDRIRRELDTRLEELRPLVQEADNLQRAAEALGPSAPAGKVNGRTRGSRARSAAPRRQGERSGSNQPRVIEYVTANPGSTASNVARALGLNPRSTASGLVALVKAGKLAKADRGYRGP
jgi:hypothetical protein